MFVRNTITTPFGLTLRSLRNFSRHADPNSHHHGPVGFVGLGNMGAKMAQHFGSDGHSVIVYDRSPDAVHTTVQGNSKISPGTLEKIGDKCTVVFSMLPNDAVVEEVSNQILKSAPTTFTDNHKRIHVSCSTISPELAKKMTKKHHEHGYHFVSAPVFARPDGISRREAIWMLSGNVEAKSVARKFLEPLGRIEDFGEETGAANVVKLCGNFLIAASIEAIAESMALAEKNGVDRHHVMQLLSTTIFDCLIYKGYGQRVSQRDHKPGGFSLELGYKDVSLVNKAARDVNVPMPFLSTLVDRFLSAKAKGRAGFDWSGIGLNVAEDAGINIGKDLERNIQLVQADHAAQHPPSKK